MRHIGHEIPAKLFHLLGSGHKVRQLLRQRIERGTQLPHLILRRDLHPAVITALRHRRRGFLHRPQRPDNAPGQTPDDKHRQRQRQQAGQRNRPVNLRQESIHSLHRRIQNDRTIDRSVPIRNRHGHDHHIFSIIGVKKRPCQDLPLKNRAHVLQ